MLASSFLDPVLGIDIHFEMVPTPAPVPTPIPNPFIGVVFDPLGLACGLAIGGLMSAVTGASFQGPVLYWTAFPATNTGTEAKHVTGHILIPPGVAWAPFPKAPKPTIHPGETPTPALPIKPENDAIVITGSKTVSVMGSNAARLGDIALSCSEPLRLPSSVVLAIPKGAPILIGGPPSLDLMAALLASLRTRFMSDAIHSLISRMKPSRMRNLLHRVACFFTGHPVDVASGKVLAEHIDAALPGPLPLQVDRIYSSAFAARDGRVGHGWSLSLDQAVWRERGRVVLRGEDGREVEFDCFDLPDRRIAPGQQLWNPIDRLTLRCLPGERWEVEAADGVVRSFAPAPGDAHDQPGALGPVARIHEMRDPSGYHRNKFHYDEHGRLAWVRDATGRVVQLEHDDAGRISALRLPRAEGEGWTTHRRYHYDDEGDLVAVDDELGATWRFEYQTHLLTRETDRTGFSYYFIYDGLGADAWCTRTWGDGGVYDHVIAYDKQGRVTYVTDSLGCTTVYRMNPAGVVISVQDPLGGVTAYEHDPSSLRRTRITDPLGNVTALDYDDRVQLTRMVLPDGVELGFEYDAAGRLQRATDALGGVWRWRHDSLGQLISVTDPLGRTSEQAWARGLPTWVRSPGGRRIAYEYDERGLLRAHRDARGRETRFTWDNLGRQTRVHEVGGAKLSLRYDPESRLVELSRPTGERQRRSYDAEGNLLEVHDPGRRVRLERGPAHKVLAREEDGERERYEYDTEGRLTARLDAAGQRVTLARDAVGRLATEGRPDGGLQRYTYDPTGRISAVRSPAGREVKLAYDARGRLTDVERSDGGRSRYEYRADGALLAAINEAAELRFERDALGRLLREASGEDWVQSRYDVDGARISVESSRGLYQELGHDQAGAVTSVLLGLAARRDGAAIELERDDAGHARTRRLPGELAVRWTRDDRGRALARDTLKVPGWSLQADTPDVVVDERRWHWQGDDRLVKLEARGELVEYDHDARGRVIRERRGELALERAQDAVGNVYRSADRSDREYRADGQLVRTAESRYRHDADGQRVERLDAGGERWRYSYDDRGLLRAVDRPDGARIEYAYDALGRRVRRSRRGGDGLAEDVRYLWDGRCMVHELRGDDDDDVVSWYWTPNDAAPVAKRRGDRLWSITADHMGNPTEMYDEDGRLAWQGRLDIYGHCEVGEGAANDCPWRWPGQYEDEDAGLHYNGFRYYDPVTGNYTSRDPLGLAGNSNAYGYPANPWAWSDPLGLVQTWEEFAAAAERWNAGEGAAHPMDHGFQARTWSLYQQTLKSKEIPVIGDFGDVARYIEKHGPGHAKLSLPMPPSTGFHWNTFVNDQWMQAFIDQRATIRLASEPTEELLKSAEYGRSVFGREMDQLTAAGYKLLGKLGNPKDPLRMEPPCK